MNIRKTLFVLLLLFSAIARAEEPGSFEAFYKQDTDISWGWVVGGALLAGGAVLVTGGTASPLVAGIGSWFGGMMGLSGAAATSAGLATLGFGSLASGGLGMAGGAAVITAGLSLAGDAAVEKGWNIYQSNDRYRALERYSESMATLCLPRNKDGSEAYETAVETLESVRFCTEDRNQPSPTQLRRKLDQVIATLRKKQEKSDIDDTVKEDVLLSLLYFIRNDYRRAHFYADLVLDYRGRNNNGMAQYIYAVTGLYLNKDSYEVLVNEYLRKSLLEDDENPLIPQLLGIFVERSLLAASLGNISLSDPVELLDILAERKSLSKYRPRVAEYLLGHYVQAGLDLQKRIESLEGAVNPLIADAPKTRQRIRAMEAKYDELLTAGHLLEEVIESDAKLKKNEDILKWLDRMHCMPRERSACVAQKFVKAEVKMAGS